MPRAVEHVTPSIARWLDNPDPSEGGNNDPYYDNPNSRQSFDDEETAGLGSDGDSEEVDNEGYKSGQETERVGEGGGHDDKSLLKSRRDTMQLPMEP